MSNDLTLGDIGERRLVAEVLPKYCHPAGDDCATFTVNSNLLVITTDPVPEPAAKVLGGDADLYWMGWLLVTINMSDIAASGARPAVFVAAIEAPPSLKLSEFERLLLGISDACSEYGAQYIGGNLREAAKLTATGTAVGTCETGCALLRSGARLGDVVASVGKSGIFWRDALDVRSGRHVQDKNASPLFRPMAQVRAMMDLQAAGAVAAAIDNSDGLIPSLQQFASSNKLGIDLELAQLRESHWDSPRPDTDVARLRLGWGDWNILCAIPDARLSEALRIASEKGHVLMPIGRMVVTANHPAVTIVGSRERSLAPRIESERFARDSWFSAGIEAYIDILLKAPLPV